MTWKERASRRAPRRTSRRTWTAGSAVGLLALVTVASPAALAGRVTDDTASSRALRDYYQSVKQTPRAERDAVARQLYEQKVLPAANTDLKRSADEFARTRPAKPAPGQGPKRSLAEKKAAHAKRKEARRKKAGGDASAPPTLGGRAQPAAPPPPRRREEVVIDGRNVPKELEFPGKNSVPSPAR